MYPERGFYKPASSRKPCREFAPPSKKTLPDLSRVESRRQGGHHQGASESAGHVDLGGVLIIVGGTVAGADPECGAPCDHAPPRSKPLRQSGDGGCPPNAVVRPVLQTGLLCLRCCLAGAQGTSRRAQTISAIG